MNNYDNDWYTYLTEDFKLDRKMYKSKDFAVCDCPKCGKTRNERVDKLKWKVKTLGYYECHLCRRLQGIQKARAVYKNKHGNINPFQLESAKEKIKKTMIERYGVDCSLKRPDVHKKGIKAAESKESRRKAKETKLKKKIRNL